MLILLQVDAHNIVPCWEASPKLEYGARTIRPKITKQLSSYLTEFPPVIRHPHKAAIKPEVSIAWRENDIWMISQNHHHCDHSPLRYQACHRSCIIISIVCLFGHAKFILQKMHTASSFHKLKNKFNMTNRANFSNTREMWFGLLDGRGDGEYSGVGFGELSRGIVMQDAFFFGSIVPTIRVALDELCRASP